MIDLAEQLRPLADAATPEAGDRVNDLRQRADRRRRNKRVVVVGLSALLIVAIVAGVAVARSAAPARPPVTSGPLPTVPSVGAAALARGHWGTIPAAPIVARYNTTIVWTGHEVIVWGGITDAGPQRLLNDGAAYDPATRTWRMLPPAPLAPRMGASAVWTGSEMIVWGGTNSQDLHAAGDGAAYDPSTNRWRRLAPSPLSPRTDAALVWTGADVVVVGGSRPWNAPSSAPNQVAAEIVQNGRPGASHESASYDPHTDRWRMLPDLPVPPHHRLDQMTAVWAAGKLLEWWSWDHTVITSEKSGISISGDGGAELYTYDPIGNAWRRDELATDGTAPAGINGAYVDGTMVVLPATQPFRLPFAKGGSAAAATDLHGWTYDTTARRYTPMSAGKLDTGHSSTSWTGDALVNLNPTTEVGGPGTNVVVGDAEAWDPATNRWTNLRRLAPPLYFSVEHLPIWTGHQLIDFGGGPARQQLSVLAGVELTPG